MNAIRLHTANGPAGLVYEQIETPQPKDGEVLVRVHAAAITRDVLNWPVERLPAIPSYEFSGVVAANGSNVEGNAIGEEVYGLSSFKRDGAAADYIVVQKEFLAPKPKTLDHVHSAAIPLAALTAWQGLFGHGQLSKGERVLIHGATGGVGHFAVQLAHQRRAYVIGTVATEDIPLASSLEMDKIIDYTKTQFEQEAGEVELVFDTAGGERLRRSAAIIRKGGRLVSVAAEPSQETAKRRGIKAVYFVVSPNREQLIEIAKLADGGVLEPIVGEVFPLDKAKEAFEHSLRRHGAGKIVLSIAEE